MNNTAAPWPTEHPVAYWLGWDLHARGHPLDVQQSADHQRGWTERAAMGIDIFDTKALSTADWETDHSDLMAAGWTAYHRALGVVYLRKPFTAANLRVI